MSLPIGYLSRESGISSRFIWCVIYASIFAVCLFIIINIIISHSECPCITVIVREWDKQTEIKQANKNVIHNIQQQQQKTV